jgi:hypothetical protein
MRIGEVGARSARASWFLVTTRSAALWPGADARAVEGRQGSMEPAEGARLIRNNMPVVLESLLVAIKHNRAVVS